MEIDKTPVVLVISTGGQDLKLWLAKAKREDMVLDQMPFPAERCREIHEALWPDPSDPRSFRAIIARELDPQAGGLSQVTAEELAADPEWFPVFKGHKHLTDRFFFRDGKVLLQPSKTMSLIAAVHPDSATDIRVDRVLLLYSQRERRPKEPIRNGVALGHWISLELGLPILGGREHAPDERGICWVNYLAGLDYYEGEADSVNFPLHTIAANSIDCAIAKTAAGIYHPFAVYSSRGGFDDVKPIVSASCALHFDGRAFCFWETEQGKQPTVVKSIDRARLHNEAVYAIPADALPARAHALGRLLDGDILGAWGSLAHLNDIKSDREWLDWVRDLARFMRGDLPAPLIQTALVDEDALVWPGVELLMLRAFQVEAALQGADDTDVRVSEALLSTAALVESALELGVFHAASAAGIPFDRATRALAAGEVAKAQEAVSQTVVTSGRWENKKQFPKLFLREDPRISAEGDYRINTMGAAAAAWRIWLDLQTRDDWRNLAAAVYRADFYLQESKIQYCRNRLAHLALIKEQADDALREAGKKLNFKDTDEAIGPLWRRHAHGPDRADGSLGGMFLDTELIKNLFKPFGIPDPAACYRRVMQEAMKALRAPIKVIP
jgi:hypothetical protein